VWPAPCAEALGRSLAFSLAVLSLSWIPGAKSEGSPLPMTPSTTELPMFSGDPLSPAVWTHLAQCKNSALHEMSWPSGTILAFSWTRPLLVSQGLHWLHHSTFSSKDGGS
jgi:hypothetical protein